MGKLPESAASIPEHADYYAAPDGGIWSTKGSEPTRLSGSYSHGYAYVNLYTDQGPKRKRVHRLVLKAFVGLPPDDAPHGCHRNGDRADNRLANLKWATPVENARDQEKHGTRIRGETHPCAKLSDRQVRQIRTEYLDPETSTYDLSDEYNVSRVQICNIVFGRQRTCAGGPIS